MILEILNQTLITLISNSYYISNGNSEFHNMDQIADQITIVVIFRNQSN